MCAHAARHRQRHDLQPGSAQRAPVYSPGNAAGARCGAVCARLKRERLAYSTALTWFAEGRAAPRSDSPACGLERSLGFTNFGLVNFAGVRSDRIAPWRTPSDRFTRTSPYPRHIDSSVRRRRPPPSALMRIKRLTRHLAAARSLRRRAAEAG